MKGNEAMQITHVTYLGEKGIQLASGDFSAVILPERGGKTASITLGDFELLAQPGGNAYPPLTPDMDFSKGDASGFDDVFPSMGVENFAFDGKKITLPDHGMIWSRPMECNIQNDSLVLSSRGTSLPYFYSKKISVEGCSIAYEYTIENRGNQPLPFLWVCHCLMHLEADCCFDFPESGKSVVCATPIPGIGNSGNHAHFPSDKYNFSSPCHEGSALKFYFDHRITDGGCCVTYPSHNIAARMHFDTEKLPYLGFWITNGGYRGDKNFAFEPASAYFDTVERAQKENALPWITPGESVKFKLTIGMKKI